MPTFGNKLSAALVAPRPSFVSPGAKSFRDRLNEALTAQKREAIGYVSPGQTAGDPGSEGFIYTPDGQIHYSESEYDFHTDIANRVPELKQALGEFPWSIHETAEEQGWLLGRISHFYYARDEQPLHVVSLWTESRDLLNRSLSDCLSRLLKDGKIDKNTFISYPPDELVPLYEISKIGGELSPEEKRRLELMRRLHLMGPKEKKAAMAELGLGGGGGQSAWQKEAEKAEIVGPGQRYWAMTSEGRHVEVQH